MAKTSGVQTAKRKDKIEFLKKHFPNIEKLDFVSNQNLFIEAKQALITAGFYKQKTLQRMSSLNDASVLNLLWDAQGRKRYKHQVNKTVTTRRVGA